MYRFPRLKGWLSLWLIVAVLGHFGLSYHEASAFVLCFGTDGHVAVEPADHEHALPHSNESSPPEAGAHTHGLKLEERPCLDLPVVSGNHGDHKLLTGPQKPLLDEGLVVAILVIAIIFFPKAIATPVFSPDPSIVDSRLIALRSVVLLN
ncbi:hypothetical protein [Nitrosococcus wardiae]|uniref:Uncharacterized protein n=1 Tax=Nitrosococcus wardiae TaxID=1814290 RepID=A0A4P7C0S2_9GAMM|nr:hypothetical protein [Nitrosococcus wardiae]QBQ55140.1 hypothetical protein E3U44_11945 [Nitrosococcus wardiae]